MAKPDIRKIFRGADAGAIIRAGAADLMQRAMANGLARERRLAAHAYMSKPTLMVQVEQVCSEPPIWRMRTMQPVVEGGGLVEVLEQDPKMLEAEMRLKCRTELLKSGYFDTYPADERHNKAREWITAMRIEREPVIHLLDSERFAGERRR